ncbi:MAG: T9SS type A sorting domain-containing protein, partial [Bacteroidia bacterium]|nr:T9SS type A sorting domain-containing protein [Bacteroidia bacterium]
SGVSRYGIAPLSPSDIGPCNVCPPSVGLRTRMPAIVSQTDSVKISTVIMADTAIASAKLYYAESTSSTFQNVDMIKEATSDKFTGTIPPFAANTLVKYFIKVIDGRGLTTIVPDSFGNGSNYYVTANGINNIRDLQYAPNPTNGASVWNGDSLAGINVTGVVTATGMNNQTIIQDGQGPNSAIFIQNSAGNAGWKIGDSVKITAARVTENFNVTTLYNVTGSVLKSGAMLPNFEMGLPIDSFRLNNVRFARPWEGVLVKWDSVYVISLNADSNANGDNFGEFTFNIDSTKTVGLRVDDLNAAILNINRTLTKGQMLSYLQGPMTFAFSNFKVIPRGLYDLGLCSMDSVKPVILASATDTVFVGSGAYMPTNISASDNKDGDLTSYILTTGMVNTSALGSYAITYTVSDFCGNMSDAVNRTVIVKDTPNTGLSSKEVVAANINVYPNPAINEITISANDVKSLPLTVAVYDMIGREMLTRTYNDKNVNETINISNFNNGIYFIVMKNQQGTHSIKFVVTGK